jgi:hypothetical protein
VNGHNIPKIFIDTNILRWGLLSESEIMQKHPSEREFLLKEVTAIRSIIELARGNKVVFV